ncbi:hypothetical protein ACGFIJ_30025 [Microbispora bryophytorum]|uniref:hypothetical protein n=1 Tax=Microbispora bryophytorum TaxID=1460882 RepID=UPI003722C28A
MTGIPDAVNDAYAEAFADPDLIDQVAAGDLAAALNRVLSPANLTGEHILDRLRVLDMLDDEQKAEEIAAACDRWAYPGQLVTPERVREFLDGPDDEIKITPGMLTPFDGIFGQGGE